MKRLFTLIAIVHSLLFTIQANAQKVAELENAPKIVVGIMVDQMRWDYLTRYYERYTDGGFRRLMAEGYNCNRLNINYIPTVTAVGHTAVYTGTVPAFNGIIANNMLFDGEWVTPVRDWNVKALGTERSEGQGSPHRLLTTTMTDELRLATNFRSKVISVSIKDRGAILPGGHCANAAYWMDTEGLQFVSSTYYMKELPKWVVQFNKQKLGQKYLAKTTTEKKDKEQFWDLLYDEDTYVQSGSKKVEKYYAQVGQILKYSPYGNTYTADMALAALDNENLGNNPDGVTDFLAISFSTTDMVGHKVGPNSIWIEDLYLHLDQDIKRLLDTLDSKFGKDGYIVWLSADHAGSYNIVFRQEHGIPAEAWPTYCIMDELNTTLGKEFGLTGKIVHSLECQQVYFDSKLIAAQCPNSLTPCELKQKLINRTIELLKSKDIVAYAYEPQHIPDYVPEPVRTMSINGYNPKRSGDIQIILEANVTEDSDACNKADHNGIPKGINHSVWSPYDAHIPFIVMGKGVRHAWDNNTYNVTDIAPTICALLNIQQPSGCVGNAINVR